MSVATEIRSARRRAGLTQAELASRVGTSQSRLSTYESGTQTPTPETLRRILDAARPLPSAVLHRHRDQVLALAETRGLTQVRVFGSVASGTDHTHSDVDLLVTAAPGVTLSTLAGFVMDLEDLLGVKVDVITDGGLAPDSEIARQAEPL